MGKYQFIQQIVLGKITLAKMSCYHLTSYTQINSRLFKSLNVQNKTIQN